MLPVWLAATNAVVFAASWFTEVESRLIWATVFTAVSLLVIGGQTKELLTNDDNIHWLGATPESSNPPGTWTYRYY
jgi:hypothetical protein